MALLQQKIKILSDVSHTKNVVRGKLANYRYHNIFLNKLNLKTKTRLQGQQLFSKTGGDL